MQIVSAVARGDVLIMILPSKMLPVEDSKKYGPAGRAVVKATPPKYFSDNKTTSMPISFVAFESETEGEDWVPLKSTNTPG